MSGGATTRIVVVGAGLAAARTVTRLRRRLFEGEVVVVGNEPHAPYDRPPLTKAFLRGETERTALRFDVDALRVELRTGTAARGLDTTRRVVVTDDGELAFDRLVIATGAHPIRLPGAADQLTLRTVDDARRLREALLPGARITIIGASWIGAEVATAALAAGCRVTCLEANSAPLAGPLGSDVGASLLEWWSDVDLHLGVSVTEVHEDGVALTDGTVIDGDVVVTAVGVRPTVDWLDGSGVAVDRGVLVDEHLRTDIDGIVALGDVCARWSPHAQAHVRIEHWQDAGSAGQVAADILLAAEGDPLPVHDPVPYFWSDQFGHKLQYVGHHGPDDRPHETEVDGAGRVVRWTSPAGNLTAVLTVDRPRDSAAAGAEIEARWQTPIPA